MPPRPTLPADDLYARLEIAVDASPEVIELAWRSLLRQHHPDVAGPDGLERSKRINVAHDWLERPRPPRALRPRARGPRGPSATPAGRDPRRAARPSAAGPASDRVDPAETLARFLERVAALEPDEIDRLACAEPAPIAFGATIARFLPPEERGRARGDGGGGRRAARSSGGRPPGRPRRRRVVRRPSSCLGPFLDELLSEPFRERTRRAAHAGLGCGRRSATLRPERRRGPGARSRGSPTWTHRASRRSPGPRSVPASTSGGSTIRGRRARRPRTTRRSGSRRSSPPGTPRPRSRTA